MSRVLAITSKSDLHVDHVEKQFSRRGLMLERLDFDRVGTDLRVTYDSAEGHVISPNTDNPVTKTTEINSVWFRKPFLSKFDRDLQDVNSAFASRECESWMEDFIFSMSQAKWVNHPHANKLADNKLRQLREAQTLGFTIPKTLVTNDPEELLRFVDKIDDRKIIYKTLSHPFIDATGTHFRSVYTSVVDITDEMLASVTKAPCLFQERVDKAYELRVTVVGNQVFSARIYSQEREVTKLDWRRAQSAEGLRHELEVMDAQVEKACVDIIRTLGLKFGTVDIIVTKSGDHVFLEVNPNGQWLWIELILGADISGALIDELLTHNN